MSSLLNYGASCFGIIACLLSGEMKFGVMAIAFAILAVATKETK